MLAHKIKKKNVKLTDEALAFAKPMLAEVFFSKSY